MKRFLFGTILLFACILIFAISEEIIFSKFQMPKIDGYTVSSTSIEEASKIWYEDYVNTLKGFQVPYEYRIEDAKLDHIEILEENFVQLDYTLYVSSANSSIIQNLELIGTSKRYEYQKQENFVQLDYTLYVSSANSSIIQNLELIGTSKRYEYQKQTVLQWNTQNGTMEIQSHMRPVQYQIQTDEFQEEKNTPQTQHYAPSFENPMTYYITDQVLYVTYDSGKTLIEVPDGYKKEEKNTPQTQHYAPSFENPMTYYITDQVLYVTYDSGKTLIEVPDGYKKICKNTNGSYQELLPSNSFIVSESFTGFIGYSSEGVVLLYSTDAGHSWQQSTISSVGFKANSFLSSTSNGYYASFAVDRALGSDYYATFFSDDLQNWSSVPTPDHSNLTCVFWSKNGFGYYASGNTVFVTKDQGQTYEELPYPEADSVADLGFQPFDTIEELYEKDDILYMIVGQGDDGDYTRNGKQIKALYQSTDGETFSFVTEIEDTAELAG